MNGLLLARQAKPNSTKTKSFFCGVWYFLYLGGCGVLKILKAINNNVVSCLDDNNKELVVMGKGLGFQAKPGTPLNTKLVEKVFRMDSPENITRLKDTFARLPENLLELCSKIIDYANQVLGRRLNESIYLTLTDHIQFAIERSRLGLDMHNALVTEVRVFYPEEYAIGK